MSNNKSFNFIKEMKPDEVRAHLNIMWRLSQNSNDQYWESYSIIDNLLTAHGLALPCPNRTMAEVIKNNKIYYRKEKT